MANPLPEELTLKLASILAEDTCDKLRDIHRLIFGGCANV